MKRAKLFRNGGSQAVRLPKEFRLPGREVSVRRMGDTLILEPIRTEWSPELTRFLRSKPEHLVRREQPKREEREELPL